MSLSKIDEPKITSDNNIISVTIYTSNVLVQLPAQVVEYVLNHSFQRINKKTLI